MKARLRASARRRDVSGGSDLSRTEPPIASSRSSAEQKKISAVTRKKFAYATADDEPKCRCLLSILSCRNVATDYYRLPFFHNSVTKTVDNYVEDYSQSGLFAA